MEIGNDLKKLGAGTTNASAGQTLPKEVEGAIELGVIRPDLLTTAQIQMIAQNLKDRLTTERSRYIQALSQCQQIAGNNTAARQY